MEEPQQVEFIVHHKRYEEKPVEVVQEIKPQPMTVPNPLSVPQTAASVAMNSRYTFDNFVVGASNRLAHACYGCGGKPLPMRIIRCFFTAVLDWEDPAAAGNWKFLRAQRKQVMYVSSEEFANDLINSIRTHNTQAFP